MLTKNEKQEDTCPFAVGDHVYMWCTILAVGRYQHHGIVIDVDDDDDNDVFTVADFTQIVAPGEFSSGSSSSSPSGDSEDREATGRMRTVDCRIEDSKWQKVEYESSRENKSDTNTASRSDPAEMVLRRVEFLLENEYLIPPYHVLRSNCECVAVWCKTGRWASLQGSTIMFLMAAGQVKSAVGVGAYVAVQTVTVPMAGFWGLFGYTSKVSLAAMYPFLIPLIAAYGTTVVGAQMVLYFRCKHFWELTSTKLNTEFWQGLVVKAMMIHNTQQHSIGKPEEAQPAQYTAQ